MDPELVIIRSMIYTGFYFELFSLENANLSQLFNSRYATYTLIINENNSLKFVLNSFFYS